MHESSNSELFYRICMHFVLILLNLLCFINPSTNSHLGLHLLLGACLHFGRCLFLCAY